MGRAAECQFAVEGADRNGGATRGLPGCSRAMTTAGWCSFAQASKPAEIAAVAAPAVGKPAGVFLQHPSDPVIVVVFRTFCSSSPDWLAESPGFDRSSAMRWKYPIVTFWQVGADLTVSATAQESSPVRAQAPITAGASSTVGSRWPRRKGWTPAD